MRIGDDKIAEIRERTDILALVESYVPLKRKGTNHFGLCPFHAEKSPSFSVNPARQIFHCFGCEAGGDAFAFLMRLEGLSFPEAAERLAQRAGIELPAEAPDPAAEQRRRERERLLRLNAAARDYYQEILLRRPEGEPGRRYLNQRGYDREMALRFGLGFAPDRWEGLAGALGERGFDGEELRQVGLTRASTSGRGDYDLFRGRLIFPILDASGEVVAFGGRTLSDRGPKYLNSPESPVYHKGRLLYGLYQAREAMRREDAVLVTEGYFDVLALHRAGVTHAVATCGTALTEEHARLLKRYARRVIFLFDQDSAGEQATWRGLDQVLPQGVSVLMATLPAGDDPDSFLQQQGRAAFDARLAEARPALELFMERRLAETRDLGERARRIDEILDKLRLLPDAIERNLYLKALAARSGSDEEVLRRQLEEHRGRPRPGGSPVPPAPAPVPPPVTAPPAAAPPPGRERQAQELLLQLLIVDPAWRARAAQDGLAQLFSDPDCRTVAAAVIAAPGESVLTEREGATLAPAQRALLSGIIGRDPRCVTEEPSRIYRDCLQAGERRRLRERLVQLQAELLAAERRGDEARSTELLREKHDINRTLKGRT